MIGGMALCLSPIAVLLQLSLVILTLGSPVEPRDATITPAPLLRREDKPANWIGYYITNNGASYNGKT